MRKFIYLASDESRSQISTFAPFLFQVPQDLISCRVHNGWVFTKPRTDQNQRGTNFCSKIEMVQLLGQLQHNVVNPILTLKFFKELSEAGRLLKLMLTTPEVLEEEQLLMNIEQFHKH